jgi:thymidylate kinase
MYTNFDSVFFKKLINNLNLSNVHYCIIGDYSNLPDSINHDIDFWTNDMHLFYSQVKRAVTDTNFQMLLVNKTSKDCNIVLYKLDNGTLIIMKIDIMTDCSYKSFIPLVDSNTIAENIITHKNFYVANKAIEATMHFLYPMLEWGSIKKKRYKEEIKDNYKSTLFVSTLKKIFGASFAAELIMLINENKWEKIERNINRYRMKALMRFVFKPVCFRQFVFFLKKNICRCFKPTGYTIALCGLDGAGKTTILNYLNEIFVDVLKKKKVYIGYWRPYLFPEIKSLFEKKNSKNASNEVDTIEKRRPKGKLISFFKLMYYLFDYMVGVLRYKGIQNRGGVVLFDRHYIDMIIYPQRFEIGLSKATILFFYKFIPKPDYIFFLWTTPEEIHKRKKEFSQDEIQKQINDYILTGKKIKNFIPIKTDKSVSEEINDIFAHISNGLNK